MIYLLKYSCARTLSIKHGKALISYRAVFQKYGKHLTVVKDGKVLAKFGRQSCAKVMNFSTMRKFKVRPLVYLGVLDRRTFRTLKMFEAQCYACGSTDNIEIHHIRRIVDLKDQSLKR